MKKVFWGLMFILMLVSPVSASQHDYVIDNQPGAAFRSDLNSAFQAIVTNNAGATEPATLYPNMWWYDVSTGLMKHRTNANDAWIILGLDAADTDGTLSANSDSKIATQKAGKTYADTKVSKSGNETVAGVKNFSSSPIVPTPTTDYQAAPKKYVDDITANLAGATFTNYQIFTSSGTFTKPSGISRVYLLMVGGGGGGGGSLCGVGYNTAGGAGGSSTFGALATAPGGSGGNPGYFDGGGYHNGGGGAGGACSWYGLSITALAGTSGSGASLGVGPHSNFYSPYSGSGGNGSSVGGGYASGGGGGGGGYFEGSVDISGNISVTVGSGGTGGITYGCGSDGSPGTQGFVLVRW